VTRGKRIDAKVSEKFYSPLFAKIQFFIYFQKCARAIYNFKVKFKSTRKMMRIVTEISDGATIMINLIVGDKFLISIV
jgi:hypothetical protein